MGRYRQGIALGIIIGAGAVLCLVSFIHLDLFSFQTFCKTDERAGSCVREWFAASAGIAAFVTILLLLRDQSFNREVAILQTLDIRTRFVTGRQIARRLRNLAEKIRASGYRWENPRHARRPPIDPRYLINNLLEIERLLLDESWDDAASFDDRIIRNRVTLIPIVADLLRTFVGHNLHFARQPQNRVTPQMINEEWEQDVTPREIIVLSYRLENLGDAVHRLAEELTNFRGTRYFRDDETEQSRRDDGPEVV